MRRPLGTSAAGMRRAPFVLVDVQTEEGVTGRAHAFCYLAIAAPMIRRVIDSAAESLIGVVVDPLEISRRLATRYRLLGVHGVVAMAISAIDVACWDALATAAGQPLAEYLGAARRDVPAYNSNALSIGDTDALGAEALELLAAGFDAVKLRLGRAAAKDDLLAIEAVRKAVPAGTLVMADYNQALTVTEALTRGEDLDGAELTWIEEPVSAQDLIGTARVASQLRTPIQLGENLYGPESVAAAIAQRSSDLLMFDLMRIGGVSGWLTAAASAGQAGIAVSSHLYPEVSVHLLAASPTGHWLEYVDWAEPFIESPLTANGGKVTVPRIPGTGVRWDAAAVRRYAID